MAGRTGNRTQDPFKRNLVYQIIHGQNLLGSLEYEKKNIR